MSEKTSEQRIQTACLLILSAVALAGALSWLKPVMVPFVLALFFSLLLQPVISFLEDRLRAPHWLAVGGALGLALLALLLTSVMGAATIAQMTENSKIYEEQLLGMRARFSASAPEWAMFGQESSPFEIPRDTVTAIVSASVNLVLSLFSQAVMVGLFMLFLLPGSASKSSNLNPTWEAMRDSMKRYLGLKTLLSALTGIATWLILQLLGVQPALVFGLFAFLLNFVPNVGSMIATLLPLPVVVVDPEIGLTVGVLAIALPGAVQFAVGNVVEPKLFGDSLDLHPVVVMMTLIFWGALWGPIGMVLATPLTAMLKMLLERIEPTAAVAELLAGRMQPPEASS